jgi:DNA polymerase III gamma/tau subunit
MVYYVKIITEFSFMSLVEEYKKSNVYTIIKNDKKNNMINHAYILFGSVDVVLKNFSLQMAKHLLCEGHNFDVCDECINCLKINKNVHSDVSVYPKNLSSVLKTEDVNLIVNDSFVVPLESNYKIYILNNFQLATESAQNKLLKTLEEPSKHVIFIINTTNLNSILKTIVSRCKTIYVANNDNFNAIDIEKLCYDIFNNMSGSSEVLFYSNKVVETSTNINDFLNKLNELICDLIKIKSQVDIKYLINANSLNELSNLSKVLTISCLNELYNEVLLTISQIEANCNKNACIEKLLLKILEVKYKCQKHAQ